MSYWPWAIVTINNSKKQQSGSQESSNTDSLPKLKVPVISGDILKWAKFHDGYAVSIHHHKGLLKSQKFAYMRNQVKGKASDIIDGLASTDASYDVCWKLSIKVEIAISAEHIYARR